MFRASGTTRSVAVAVVVVVVVVESVSVLSRKPSIADANPRSSPTSLPMGAPTSAKPVSKPSWREFSFPDVIPSR